jgi:anti-anti-sigma regulatory factor
MARRLLPSTVNGRGIPVTLKIETASDGHSASLRLIGRIEAEYLDELEAHVRKHRPLLVLDLDEVTLVDVAVVRFLIACEAEGIELRHCAPYIREWMRREQRRGE